MKRKNQKSKNGKQRMPFTNTIELPQQIIEDKKVHNNLRIMKKMKSKDQVCESIKTPQRNLRARTVKNYNEKSKVNFKPKEKKVNKKSPVNKNDTERIPIYKTVDLLEEKAKSPEEIYEFIDDSPVSDQKGKKKKQSMRKLIIRQAKKFTGLKYDRSQKSKTKPIKNFSRNVQLKEQEKQSINNNNSITFQPNIQKSNESNHSLIWQSLSPISKTVDNLSIESPSLKNTSSQVQKVIQSTPLISRVLTGQKKKSLAQIINKDNEKLTKPSGADIIQDQKKNESPRKFGTEISNLNSMEHVTTSSVEQALPLQILQLTLNTMLSPISSENNENDEEMQDDSLPMSSLQTMDNRKDNILSLNKSQKKKVDQLISPLRFENTIQSFKQIDADGSKSNAENLNSQKENKNPDSVVKPSDTETTKTAVLRQSNLNNFLNLDEMPESSRISTAHGIFDDINNPPINGKKSQTICEESNAQNIFGLKTCIYSEKSSPIKIKSISKIATARDVARSVKGKLFLKARIKSSLARRVPENLIKKTLLKNIAMKNSTELRAHVNEEIIEKNDIENEKSKSKNNTDDENEKNTSLIDTDNESNKSLMEDENEMNKSHMEEEIEKNTGLVKDRNEMNTSHMEGENLMNTNHIEGENVINTNHMEDVNEMNSSLLEDENEMNTNYLEDENEENAGLRDVENNNIVFASKKAFLDSVSFSDTFDFLSENGEDISSKVPDEIPLFVDTEPVHFSQPPRRSYIKTKRAICSKTSRSANKKINYKEDDFVQPKKRRKKVSRLSKEEQKQMQEWIKSVNETFDEIDQFNLTIE